MNHNKDCLYSD